MIIGLLNHKYKNYDGPKEALQKYLIDQSIPFTSIDFPLQYSDKNVTTISIFNPSLEVNRLSIRNIESKSFYSLKRAIEIFRVRKIPNVRYLFAFNPLAFFYLIVKYKSERQTKVIWFVDFTPKKKFFTPYLFFEKMSIRKSGYVIEVSESALKARVKRTRINYTKKAIIIPMSLWDQEIYKKNKSSFNNRSLVFFGNIDKRNGSEIMARLFPIVLNENLVSKIDIIGQGPEVKFLMLEFKDFIQKGRIQFHGYVEDTYKLKKVLDQSSIALAPYSSVHSTFSWYADPYKLKYYLGSSTPILMTAVPPNSRFLQENKVADIVESEFDMDEWKKKIIKIIDDYDVWVEMSNNAYLLANEYRWDHQFGKLFQLIKGN